MMVSQLERGKTQVRGLGLPLGETLSGRRHTRHIHQPASHLRVTMTQVVHVSRTCSTSRSLHVKKTQPGVFIKKESRTQTTLTMDSPKNGIRYHFVAHQASCGWPHSLLSLKAHSKLLTGCTEGHVWHRQNKLDKHTAPEAKSWCDQLMAELLII